MGVDVVRPSAEEGDSFGAGVWVASAVVVRAPLNCTADEVLIPSHTTVTARIATRVALVIATARA